MNLKIEPFCIAHFLAVNPTVDQVNAAIVSQISGPAYTLMTDERRPKILACGGIRSAGIGQAWAVFNPDALEDHPIIIARKAAVVLEACMAEEKTYRVYAEASEGAPVKWFEHLGFRHSEKLYVR